MYTSVHSDVAREGDAHQASTTSKHNTLIQVQIL